MKSIRINLTTTQPWCYLKFTTLENESKITGEVSIPDTFLKLQLQQKQRYIEVGYCSYLYLIKLNEIYY